MLALLPDCFLPMSQLQWESDYNQGNCDVSYQSNAECVHLLILVVFENLNLKTNKKPKTDYEDVGSTELKTSLCVEGPGNKHVCPYRALN